MRYETHNLLALSLMHHLPLGQRAFWLSCVLTEAQAVFFFFFQINTVQDFVKYKRNVQKIINLCAGFQQNSFSMIARTPHSSSLSSKGLLQSIFISSVNRKIMKSARWGIKYSHCLHTAFLMLVSQPRPTLVQQFPYTLLYIKADIICRLGAAVSMCEKASIKQDVSTSSLLSQERRKTRRTLI